MALLFMDGFDAGDGAMKWNLANFYATSTTTRFSIGRSISGSDNLQMTKYITPTAGAIVVGFAFYEAGGIGNIYSSDMVRYYTDSAASLALSLRVNTNGALHIMRGSTSIANSAMGLVNASTWNYIEFSAKISSTVGTADVRLNGVTVASFSGNTKNTGTSDSIDAVRVAGTFGGQKLIDDFYVLDTTGAGPYNTFLGDVRVYTSTPDGAGATTQFVPSSGANYTTVDELPYSASDYVQSPTPGNRDTYTMSDLPTGAATIYAVQNNVIAKKTDAGTISLRPVTRSGGTNYYGTTTALTASDIVITDLRQTDPSTSSAWTPSGVNSMESGMEVA